MTKLSNTVYSYYLSRLTDLPIKDRFHFASRLYLWRSDEECLNLLHQLRPWFTSDGDAGAAIRKVAEEAKASAGFGSKNADRLRQPYFDKYPRLKSYVSVLFRINFLQTIYQVDCGDLFYEIFDKSEADNLLNQLIADQPALSVLSTHAINFIYLYCNWVLKDASPIKPEDIFKLGLISYDLDDKIQLQLLIYLFTHCIIGESLFYYQAIPKSSMGPYEQMLDHLEDVISRSFQDINLDNKFEFLVCNKLLNQKSALEDLIFDEASRSVSSEGDFLIDRHNLNPQALNTSLDKSEHRNVLYIMATSDFKQGAN